MARSFAHGLYECDYHSQFSRLVDINKLDGSSFWVVLKYLKKKDGVDGFSEINELLPFSWGSRDGALVSNY